MLDGRKTGSDEGNVGIGAFGSGSADLLVWTAGASIALAGALRFGTRAVFCERGLVIVKTFRNSDLKGRSASESGG